MQDRHLGLFEISCSSNTAVSLSLGRKGMWKVVALLKDILREMKKDNVGAFAAQAAFFLVLSAIPFLILFIYLIQFTAVSEVQIISLIKYNIPTYVAPFIISIIEEMYTNQTGVMSLAIISALWSSAKGIQVLSNGLNTIYSIEENRSWIVLRFRAIFYTLIFTVGIVFSSIVFMFGGIIRDQLEWQFDFINVTLNMVIYFRYIIFFTILFVLFILILQFLPNRKAKLRTQLIPAAIAAVGWILLSNIITVYIDFFDGFSMYGSMMTIMLILMWLYFGMYILLIVAELDSMYEATIRMQIRKKKESFRQNKEKRRISRIH